jgi:hypothetical protein
LTQRGLLAKKELLKKQSLDLDKHLNHLFKLNIGLTINMISIPTFFYGFLVALCRRFD